LRASILRLQPDHRQDPCGPGSQNARRCCSANCTGPAAV
jgi:hypothetical protein